MIPNPYVHKLGLVSLLKVVMCRNSLGPRHVTPWIYPWVKSCAASLCDNDGVWHVWDGQGWVKHVNPQNRLSLTPMSMAKLVIPLSPLGTIHKFLFHRHSHLGLARTSWLDLAATQSKEFQFLIQQTTVPGMGSSSITFPNILILPYKLVSGYFSWGSWIAGHGLVSLFNHGHGFP